MSDSNQSQTRQGMHTVSAHLVCDGAARAIAFYQQAFGAEDVMRVAGPDGRLGHARIRIGDSLVMLVDQFPEWGSFGPRHLGGSPVVLHLLVPDVDAVYAQAVAAGATAVMPVSDMFWGDRYGMVEDPFGHRWSIATHVRDVPQEELEAAMAKSCT